MYEKAVMVLKDAYNRRLDYLRVSITDKCNLRCVYCMPAEGVCRLAHDEVLRNEEFIHLIGLFISFGVKKVRFTGGEPLLRKGFMSIITDTGMLYPDVELCLTTNGVLLDTVLEDLKKAGLRKINISLDSLSEERYNNLTRSTHFNRVIANIDRALSHGSFDIKLNAVLLEETLDEIENFINFARDRLVTLRFIEKMPFTPDGGEYRFMPSERLIGSIEKLGKLVREPHSDTAVAAMYTLHLPGGAIVRLGVIPPITHKFCSTCNRLRLTCDGMLRTCLHSPVEYDLKGPYRADMGDEALLNIIKKAISEKPREHRLEKRGEDGDGCTSLAPDRNMSRIGG
jgi:GTP 3',8-cyclase